MIAGSADPDKEGGNMLPDYAQPRRKRKNKKLGERIVNVSVTHVLVVCNEYGQRCNC